MCDRILVALPTDEDDQEDYLNLSATNPYWEFRCPEHGATDALRIAVVWSSKDEWHDRDAVWPGLSRSYANFLAGGREVSFAYHWPFEPGREWERIRSLQPGLRPGAHREFSRRQGDPYFATLRELQAASTCAAFMEAGNTLRNALCRLNDWIDLCGENGRRRAAASVPPPDAPPPNGSTRDRLGLWRHAAMRWRSGFALARRVTTTSPEKATSRLEEEIEWLRQLHSGDAPILRAEAELSRIAAAATELDKAQSTILQDAVAAMGDAAGLFRDLLRRDPRSIDEWAESFRQIDRFAADCDNYLSKLNTDPIRSPLTPPEAV
jgi:hypothetical protein